MHKRTTLITCFVLVAAILVAIYLPVVRSNNVTGAGGEVTPPTQAPGPEDMTMVDPNLLPFCPDDPANTPAPAGGCKIKSSPVTPAPGDMPWSVPYPSRQLQLGGGIVSTGAPSTQRVVIATPSPLAGATAVPP